MKIGLHPSETQVLFHSLQKTIEIAPDRADPLQQINALQYTGWIPPKEAILLKNNLHDTLFVEGILSDLILELIQQGRLAPEMKHMVGQRKFEETLLILYISSLEQTYSNLEPVYLQQRIAKSNLQQLLLRKQEAEEMESKMYVASWLQSLKVSSPHVQELLSPLLSPLAETEFKQQFLSLLDALLKEETSLAHRLSLTELKALLQNQPTMDFFLTLARFLKAHHFYQKQVQSIQHSVDTDLQLSLFLASDALKNAPFAQKIPTYYSLVYGCIRNAGASQDSSPIKRLTALVSGRSPDEISISQTVQKVFQKKKQAFFLVKSQDLKQKEPLEKRMKDLVQLFLKKAPQGIIAPICCQEQELFLETAKGLNLPIALLPSYTKASQWDEAFHSAASLRIGFPTPVPVEFLEEIDKSKIQVVGTPGTFENTASAASLKSKWGFSPEDRVILIYAPEGESPWPAFLAKEYRSHKNLAVVVVTQDSHRSFIHGLKTKIAPETPLPFKVYSSLTPREKEELLTLADLAIAKENAKDSSLLFEATQAKTPLLLDNTPSSRLSESPRLLLKKFLDLFSKTKEPFGTQVHDQWLSDLHLGIMIRSKKNFKPALEELLTTPPEIRPLPTLAESVPSLLKELGPSQAPPPFSQPLELFTSGVKEKLPP